MKIGLLDLEELNGSKFPNLALMQFSTYAKLTDDVEKYNIYNYYDEVYVYKVFSFTPDVEVMNCQKRINVGIGWDIEMIDGQEIYHMNKADRKDWLRQLPPDYSMYPNYDKALGYLTVGCSRGCSFCPTQYTQGKVVRKINDLNVFWHGQKEIVLLDPNILQYEDRWELYEQLIESKAYIDFCQGLDILLVTDRDIEYLKRMKIKYIHFAMDHYPNRMYVYEKLKYFKEKTGWNRSKIVVYVLTNYDTTLEQDVERIKLIKSLNFQPYVMRYDKEHLERGNIQNALARWVNLIPCCWKYDKFIDFAKNVNKGAYKYLTENNLDI